MPVRFKGSIEGALKVTRLHSDSQQLAIIAIITSPERRLTCQKGNVIHILLAHREPIRRSTMNDLFYLTVIRGIGDFYERLPLLSQYSCGTRGSIVAPRSASPLDRAFEPRSFPKVKGF